MKKGERRSRPRRRGLVAGALTLVAMVACLWVPVSAAAALPACPSSLAALEIETPDFGRSGTGIAVEIWSQLERQPANVTLEAGSAEPRVITVSRERTTVVVPAGSSRSDWKVVLRWTQEEGTLAACAGRVERTIAIVPRWATVGEPDRVRLEGRFKLREQIVSPRRKPPYAAIWRFKPVCDIWACATKVRSNLTLRGTFDPAGPRSYTALKVSGPKYACTGKVVNRFTGETIRRFKIRRAYIEENRFRIWATRVSSNGDVLRFAGRTRSILVPVGRAKRIGCRDFGWVERISGRRL